MTPPALTPITLPTFDDETRALVRLSAVVAGGDDEAVRHEVAAVASEARAGWVEEVLLQSYLFVGFPRALNAMREWRRVHPDIAAPAGSPDAATLRADGERTCGEVYGAMYDRLRENIRGLHPLFDEWMIVEGYGKVLSRSALDLGRRELCIVAACAVTNQDRQLHSHLHGALNVGVDQTVVTQALEAISDLLGAERARSVQLLWARVRGK